MTHARPRAKSELMAGAAYRTASTMFTPVYSPCHFQGANRASDNSIRSPPRIIIYIVPIFSFFLLFSIFSCSLSEFSLKVWERRFSRNERTIEFNEWRRRDREESSVVECRMYSTVRTALYNRAVKPYPKRMSCALPIKAFQPLLLG